MSKPANPTPGPLIQPLGPSFATKPPIRTFDRGSPQNLFWVPDDLGTFTHQGFCDGRDDPRTNRIDGESGWKNALWLPNFPYIAVLPGPPESLIEDIWWCTFGGVKLGQNTLYIFALQASIL